MQASTNMASIPTTAQAYVLIPSATLSTIRQQQTVVQTNNKQLYRQITISNKSGRFGRYPEEW